MMFLIVFDGCLRLFFHWSFTFIYSIATRYYCVCGTLYNDSWGFFLHAPVLLHIKTCTNSHSTPKIEVNDEKYAV